MYENIGGMPRCYAEKFTEWINGLGTTDKYRAGFGTVVCHEDALDMPLKRKKAETYFVNSMADTFHKDVPLEFIQKYSA